MPFALHTCGVTTPLHDTWFPIGHDCFTTLSRLTTRAPFKKGEGCAAAADDSRLHALRYGKKRSAVPSLSGAGTATKAPLFPPTSRLFLLSSFRVTSSKTVAAGYQKSAAPSVAVPVPSLPPPPASRKEASARPCGFFDGNNTTDSASPLPAADSSVFSDFESPPERDCCVQPPAGFVPHRHRSVRPAERSSPAWPRRRSPAPPSAGCRAKSKLTPRKIVSFHQSLQSRLTFPKSHLSQFQFRTLHVADADRTVIVPPRK
jgi:hypothetical protein